MSFFTQSAFILGLFSFGLGVWTAYRNWKHRFSISFSVLCIVISIWSLSVVWDFTYGGMLFRDIHWITNLWIAPLGIHVLNQVFVVQENKPKFFERLAFLFSILITILIIFRFNFKLYDLEWMRLYVPVLLIVHFFWVIALDIQTSIHRISGHLPGPHRRVLYLGLGLCLMACTQDHFPEIPRWIPTLGNLLLAIYLWIASFVLVPGYLFNLFETGYRLIAVAILALFLTSVFMLIRDQSSRDFSGFFLSAFTSSFVVLILWTPLLSFIENFWKRIPFRAHLKFHQGLSGAKKKIQSASDESEVLSILQKSIQNWSGSGVSFTPEDHPNRHFNFPLRMSHRIEGFFSTCEKTEPIFHLNLSRISDLQSLIEEGARQISHLRRMQSVLDQDRLVTLGLMSAGLAHEIRNPLSSMKGALSLMGQPAPGNETWVRILKEEADRLERLVIQFLDLSGSRSLEVQPIEIVEFVEQALDRLGFSNVHLSLVEGVQKSARVYGSRDEVGQVLWNLVRNAEKAQQEANRTSPIQVHIHPDGFSVKDQGMGISSEDILQMTRPFFSKFKNGTGLGLSVCQKWIQEMGGRMMFHSVLGQGTEVRVFFRSVDSEAS